MNSFALRYILFILLACLLTSSQAHAQRTSADVVKATATADRPDDAGKQTLTITLTIDIGWHLFANPIQNRELEDEQTVIKVTAATKLAKVDFAYPAGTLVKDTIIGDYWIYENTVTVKATVVRALGDTGPLEVQVRFRAMNHHVCVMPAMIKLSVK